nr:NUDIX domain-containing protein [Brevibacillus fulvus]
MYILFQRRHPRKDTFPGHYDITCAGHLTAGEQPEDGVREISEELGLQVSFHDLQPLGVHKLVNLDGPLVDREISHVYAYRCAQALDQYILQPDEVSSLVKMNLDQALSLFSGTQSSAIVEGVALQPDGQMTCLSETVTLTDFVPHGAPYYLQVLQTIRSFCQKE